MLPIVKNQQAKNRHSVAKNPFTQSNKYLIAISYKRILLDGFEHSSERGIYEFSHPLTLYKTI